MQKRIILLLTLSLYSFAAHCQKIIVTSRKYDVLERRSFAGQPDQQWLATSSRSYVYWRLEGETKWQKPGTFGRNIAPYLNKYSASREYFQRSIKKRKAGTYITLGSLAGFVGGAIITGFSLSQTNPSKAKAQKITGLSFMGLSVVGVFVGMGIGASGTRPFNQAIDAYNKEEAKTGMRKIYFDGAMGMIHHRNMFVPGMRLGVVF